MSPPAESVFAAFLVFCRVGGCLMMVPGFSSPRLPVRIRLLMALGVALAVMPLVHQQVMTSAAAIGEALRPVLVLSETLLGAAIGLTARLYLLGLQFAAIFAANAIGLAGIPGQPLEDSEALPPISSIISLAAVMMLFASGLHLVAIAALIESYGALPIRLAVDPVWLGENLTASLAQSSLMALQLAGPFAVYAVVVNFAMGLANKFVPQVSMYFASLGVVTMGGLLLLWVVAPGWLAIFRDSYAGWLARGGDGH